MTPALIHDINQAADPASQALPQDFVIFGSSLIFTGWSYQTGRELWQTDGTEAGTTLLKDFSSGDRSSFKASQPHLRNVNGTLYILLDYGSQGPELWTSDGTTTGTRLVAALPGSEAVFSSLLQVGNVFVFVMNSNQLWRSDGTAAGTYKFFDGEASQFMSLGSRLLFTTANGLWQTDGSVNGTSLLTEGTILSLRLLGSNLFFIKDNGSNNDIWTTDGTTAGTKIVKDFPTDANRVTLLTITGNEFYFWIAKTLWKSDGTTLGTLAIKEFADFPCCGTFVPYNGTVYFSIQSGNGWSEPLVTNVWRSDGTMGGTTILTTTADARITPLVVYHDQLILMADPRVGQNRLYVSDGTPAGTTLAVDNVPYRNASTLQVHLDKLMFISDLEILVSDATPSGTFTLPERPFCFPCSQFVELNGALFYTSYKGELVKTDGTLAGTSGVIELGAAPGSSNPRQFTQIGTRTFFSANDGVHGNELWVSDGPASQPRLVKDIYPGGDANPRSFLSFQGDLVFVASMPSPNANRHAGLWRTDGTEAGTVLIQEVESPADDVDPIQPPVLLNDRIYYGRYRVNDFWDLWTSDGTAQGTIRVTSISPYVKSSVTLTAWHDKLYFGVIVYPYNGGRNPDSGSSSSLADKASFESSYALWESDGTETGTHLIVELTNIPYNPVVFHPTPSILFFSYGGVLYRTDGTRAGTYQLRIVERITESVVVGQSLVFIASESPNYWQRELWKTDGTVAGTVLLKDIKPGADGSQPTGLVSLGRVAAFAADDGVHGRELWTTDGTTAGTTMVADITPGGAPTEAGPGGLVNVGGKLLFAADDHEHGYELWESDGTAAGTRLKYDLAPGPFGSHPGSLTYLGDTLWFAADGGGTGSEPWTVDLPFIRQRLPFTMY